MVVLYASISVFNLMRAATGSQCFSHRGQLRDSYVTITEDSNAH